VQVVIFGSGLGVLRGLLGLMFSFVIVIFLLVCVVLGVFVGNCLVLVDILVFSGIFGGFLDFLGFSC